MTKYETKKNETAVAAVLWQQWAAERNLSYGELWEYQQHFRKIARRFGLIKEFKENGII